MTPILAAERLTRWYGPSQALAGVSFGIAPGEVVGLLGPNGSGKSTLLRILAGYLAPSSGMARIEGLDVVEDSLALRGRLGYVPEDASLYDGMRAGEFLRFMAGIKGLAGAPARRAVEEAGAALQLEPVMGRPIARLSRGYRQRLAIAQALLGDPPVLLLDEPTNALDARQVIAVRGLIRGLAGRRTVLVASHVLSEIERVAGRVMVLLDGRLLTADAAAEPAAGPHSLRVRVAAPPDAALACLRGVAGVRRVAADPEAGGPGMPPAYRVEAAPRPRLAEDLAAAVAHAGLGLAELVRTGPDLEQVFLALTWRAAEAAAA
jgi:ABC-2 type transport system ATP-binding protein